MAYYFLLKFFKIFQQHLTLRLIVAVVQCLKIGMHWTGQFQLQQLITVSKLAIPLKIFPTTFEVHSNIMG